MSADRADFMSRLFARPRPAGVTGNRTARGLFDAFAAVAPSEELAHSNLHAVIAHLKHGHGFPLSEDDERGIARDIPVVVDGWSCLARRFRGRFVDSLVP